MNEQDIADLKKLWSHALTDMDMKFIHSALDDILKGETEFNAFPPTPQQFLNLCKLKKADYDREVQFSRPQIEQKRKESDSEFVKRYKIMIKEQIDAALIANLRRMRGFYRMGKG